MEVPVFILPCPWHVTMQINIRRSNSMPHRVDKKEDKSIICMGKKYHVELCCSDHVTCNGV